MLLIRETRLLGASAIFFIALPNRHWSQSGVSCLTWAGLIYLLLF
ncbi:UNVERIFIED_CONTAM: hypothetical protein GTU68_066407 [Idotea baltica]|nr:hypothetical protein [Idotea baltica]